MLQKAEDIQEAFIQLRYISKKGFIHFNNNVSCTVRTTPVVLLRTRPSFALLSQFSLVSGENNQWSQLCERDSVCHTTLQCHLGITRYSSWTMNAEDPQNQNFLLLPSPFQCQLLIHATCSLLMPGCWPEGLQAFRHLTKHTAKQQWSKSLQYFLF